MKEQKTWFVEGSPTQHQGVVEGMPSLGETQLWKSFTSYQNILRLYLHTFHPLCQATSISIQPPFDPFRDSALLRSRVLTLFCSLCLPISPPAIFSIPLDLPRLSHPLFLALLSLSFCPSISPLPFDRSILPLAFSPLSFVLPSRVLSTKKLWCPLHPTSLLLQPHSDVLNSRSNPMSSNTLLCLEHCCPCVRHFISCARFSDFDKTLLLVPRLEGTRKKKRDCSLCQSRD